MKTKELIELLQAADPTGECVVMTRDGCPFEVSRKPSYYDGSTCELILNDDGQPIGMSCNRSGVDKLVIESLDLDDVISNSVKAKIEAFIRLR